MDDDLHGADERPATTGRGDPHVTDPHTTGPDDDHDEVQVDDLLEDVSIDGMCGVY